MEINNLLIYLFEDVNMKNTLKLMHIIDHINKKEEKSKCTDNIDFLIVQSEANRQ